jgi:hypothetical protein
VMSFKVSENGLGALLLKTKSRIDWKRPLCERVWGSTLRSHRLRITLLKKQELAPRAILKRQILVHQVDSHSCFSATQIGYTFSARTG